MNFLIEKIKQNIKTEENKFMKKNMPDKVK